jgi:hypothetical protein
VGQAGASQFVDEHRVRFAAEEMDFLKTQDVQSGVLNDRQNGAFAGRHGGAGGLTAEDVPGAHPEGIVGHGMSSNARR